MEIDLPISLVFLDTSVYVSTNYAFDGPLFSALRVRIENQQVRLGITPITVLEVEAKIRTGVSEAQEALEKAKNKAFILRNSQEGSIVATFLPWNKQEIEDELVERFRRFLLDFNVEVLAYEEINVKEVFDLYFDKKSPFGDAKKKNEFPDAFALKIIEGWSIEEGKRIYVVSHDGDMRYGVGSFSGLDYSPSLPELLSTLSFKYEELAPLCAEVYDLAREEIDQELASQFSDRGFYVDDQQGDVDEVYDVAVDDYEPRLLKIEHDQNDDTVLAEFEVIPNISFKAHLTYDDLATASYDSEDKVLIPWRTITEEVESSEIVMSNVKLHFPKGSPKDYKVEDVSVDHPDSVMVSSSESADWPYK
ncbi:MAG: PIN domain-containing protein [Deltaproteobacteria bacterium]|nr:PIN domain-containing protein [Deltaproteobacteria bacterium]